MIRIKMHSSVLCGVVAVALSSLVLAGCATTPKPAAEATKGKAITVWTTDTLPDRVAATKVIIAKFTASTGINVKLDTYRYVGIPHALVMREKGMCLEEYIEYLMENKHLAVYEDGIIKYEIFRAEADTADTQVSIPAGGTTYSVSSDNMGGIICAITY